MKDHFSPFDLNKNSKAHLNARDIASTHLFRRTKCGSRVVLAHSDRFSEVDQMLAHLVEFHNKAAYFFTKKNV